MKKLALITLVAATAATSFGQGFLDWGNAFAGGERHPIYGPEAGNPGLSISGQSALGTPVGATAYSGGLLTGTGFTFAIYAGPANAADSTALSLLVSTTFRTTTATGLPKGLVLGGTVTVPGVTAGNSAKFQVRAWDNAGGTLTSWAQATQAVGGSPFIGSSSVVTSGLLGGVDSLGNIVANPATIGWTSFNIYAVPEPSTFVLAGLGAAGLLIFRRRK
jgi:hypothetical protein